MIPIALVAYVVVALAVPVVIVVIDSPDPDPVMFLAGVWFGFTWPIYAPFVALWFCAKGIGHLLHGGRRDEV